MPYMSWNMPGRTLCNSRWMPVHIVGCEVDDLVDAIVIVLHHACHGVCQAGHFAPQDECQCILCILCILPVHTVSSHTHFRKRDYDYAQAMDTVLLTKYNVANCLLYCCTTMVVLPLLQCCTMAVALLYHYCTVILLPLYFATPYWPANPCGMPYCCTTPILIF